MCKKEKINSNYINDAELVSIFLVLQMCETFDDYNENEDDGKIYLKADHA